MRRLAGMAPRGPIFEPEAHLVQDGPTKCWTMPELGFEADPTTGLGDYAMCEPFRLLTDEGVAMVRDEVERLRELTRGSSPMAPNVLRAVGDFSPFLYDLTSSEELATLVSNAVRTSVIAHPMTSERAHVNMSLPIGGSSSLFAPPPRTTAAAAAAAEDEASLGFQFDWHFDSQPFVCIMMLSDMPEHPVGGQTLIRKSNGEVVKLQYPGAGYAYILQGSAIEHLALSASNYNRVTMITSFIGADPATRDLSDLRCSSTYTHHGWVASEYVRYRLQRLASRAGQRSLGSFASRSRFDNDAAKSELDQLLQYVQHTRNSLDVIESRRA